MRSRRLASGEAGPQITISACVRKSGAKKARPWMWSRCRWVSSRLIRVGSSGSARPRPRMPVPASSDQQRAVGEGDADAGGVAAVADRLRAGGGDRAARPPEVDLHAAASVAVGRRRRPAGGVERGGVASAGKSVLDRPEDRDAALRAVRGEDREGRAFDRVDLAVEGADAEGRVGGTSGADRAHHRQLVVGDRLAGLVVGAEEAAPLARADVADLVEALAEQRPGGLVVEDEQAALVDQEGRASRAPTSGSWQGSTRAAFAAQMTL